mgnify:CR=1 FL=1
MPKKFCLLIIACILHCSFQGRDLWGGKSMDIKITSKAFEEGGTIPEKYTCEGDNVSPPLVWTSVPEGTKSMALICDDPDAPMGTWVHWVLFDLPPSVRELAENVPAQRELKSGAKQGTNDFREIGYGGPCPPPGRAHRYYFKLYALDKVINLSPGASKSQLVEAMKGHILAEGKLMGKFKR